jgi:hypothetical protein
MNLLSYFTKKNTPFSYSQEKEDLFSRLEKYYDSNDLYENLNGYKLAYPETFVEEMKPLRNPVNRTVEFYVSKLLPGNIQLTASDNIKQYIEDFYKWSNFTVQKQASIREFALFGNLFWKVVSDGNKVWLEDISPKYVTSFKTDPRGYLTEIRIDIPRVDDNNKHYTYIEYWNKDYFATWKDYTGSKSLDNLGDPQEYATLAEIGIDFIPIVFIKFKDTGKKWGDGCVNHALLKIDEVNRQATRLHSMLFRYNKALLVLSAGGTDKDGRPLPPPPVTKNTELKDNSILSLPGSATLSSLVPDINYSDALAVVNAQMAEIEKDLPELKYSSLDTNSLSGKAIRLLLGPAIERAKEAQANLIAGLIRVNEIALTIGKNYGIFPDTIGNYEAGDFEHSIIAPEIIQLEQDEEATTLKTLIEAGLPLKSALKLMGYSATQIDEIMADKLEENSLSSQALANSLATFNGA